MLSNNLYIYIIFYLNNVILTIYGKWICVGKAAGGSCYIKKEQLESVSFLEAQQSCREQGHSSLAIFNTVVEAESLLQIFTLDIQLNLNNEQALLPIYYWVGLKYSHARNSFFWLNSLNDKTITVVNNSVLSTFRIASEIVIDQGNECAALEIKKGERLEIFASFRILPCETSFVKNFLCEKSDPNFDSFFWVEWSSWSNGNCQVEGAYATTRSRSCYGYLCELEGLIIEEQRKACCDVPHRNISKGGVVRQFDLRLVRVVENNSLEVSCENGFVHPVTRNQVQRSVCIMDEKLNKGRWSVLIPETCFPVDCGVPPPRIFTAQSSYVGTKYLDVAIYPCHSGFRNSRDNSSSVSLLCSNSDFWIETHFDFNAKAVCEPRVPIITDWRHYPIDGDFPGGSDHCYRLYLNASTWSESMNNCDGDLLHIQTSDEFQFLKKFILDLHEEVGTVWLAGKKKMEETQFMWHYGSNFASKISSFMNWQQPGPYLGSFHRDLCIALNYSEGLWKWVNITCDYHYAFICKTLHQKRHGVWSSWTEWSECDSHGSRERIRICNNPVPLCGGNYCSGPSSQVSYCCHEPDGEPQFADLVIRSESSDSGWSVQGDYITYKCWYGFEHENKEDIKNLTCTINGSWCPREAPKCFPRQCPHPVNGTNSIVSISSPYDVFYHGHVAMYNCLQGFAVSKDPSANTSLEISCEDGQWAGPPLQCFAVACRSAHPMLTDDEYKARHIKTDFTWHKDTTAHSSWGWDSATNATFLYQDKIQHFCEHGYQSGKKIDYNITCSSDGNWRSSDDAFLHHPDSCNLIFCSTPPPQPLPSSYWISGKDPNDLQSTGLYLDSANYNCDDGYRVNTTSGDVLLTYSFFCGASSDWKDEGSPTSCIRQSCGHPGAGKNVANYIATTYFFNDYVDYVCKEGYAYENTVTQRRVYCQLPEDGSAYVTWSDSALDCTKVRCLDPGIGENATRTVEGLEFSDLIVYSCIPDHVLVGGRLEKLWIRCTAQGTWNGTAAPSCEPAVIATDFSVRPVKPYAAEAMWIMSEKYDGIKCTFRIEYSGNPGYVSLDGVMEYFPNVSEYSTHSGVEVRRESMSGLIKAFIYTKPDYIYQFKLYSESAVSNQIWSEARVAVRIHTGGGAPFVGSVQLQNLPNIIPLNHLPQIRKRPKATDVPNSDSFTVQFDGTMFSEQNSTILAFAVIVKEVHPWHATEGLLSDKGYHDVFPENLLVWNQLEIFTHRKHEMWPAYFATPLCNIFDPASDCEHMIGLSPNIIWGFQINNTQAKELPKSVYSRFARNSKDFSVQFMVGLNKNCSLYNHTVACNGPLRKNRRFCVKLRAYSRYGYNDSMCSNIVRLKKALEGNKDLIVPTVFAMLPFLILIAFIAGFNVKGKNKALPIVIVEPIIAGPKSQEKLPARILSTVQRLNVKTHLAVKHMKKGKDMGKSTSQKTKQKE